MSSYESFNGVNASFVVIFIVCLIVFLIFVFLLARKYIQIKLAKHSVDLNETVLKSATVYPSLPDIPEQKFNRDSLAISEVQPQGQVGIGVMVMDRQNDIGQTVVGEPVRN